MPSASVENNNAKFEDSRPDASVNLHEYIDVLGDSENSEYYTGLQQIKERLKFNDMTDVKDRSRIMNDGHDYTKLRLYLELQADDHKDRQTEHQTLAVNALKDADGYEIPTDNNDEC